MIHREENGRVSTDWNEGLKQCGGRIWRGNKCHFLRSGCKPARTEHKRGIKIQFAVVQRRRTSTFHSALILFFLMAVTSPSLLECFKQHQISHLHLLPGRQEVKLRFEFFSCSMVFLSPPHPLVWASGFPHQTLEPVLRRLMPVSFDESSAAPSTHPSCEAAGVTMPSHLDSDHVGVFQRGIEWWVGKGGLTPPLLCWWKLASWWCCVDTSCPPGETSALQPCEL